MTIMIQRCMNWNLLVVARSLLCDRSRLARDAKCVINILVCDGATANYVIKKYEVRTYDVMRCCDVCLPLLFVSSFWINVQWTREDTLIRLIGLILIPVRFNFPLAGHGRARWCLVPLMDLCGAKIVSHWVIESWWTMRQSHGARHA